MLAKINADEALRRIPVVVLASSQTESDMVKNYNLNANCYITKRLTWSTSTGWSSASRAMCSFRPTATGGANDAEHKL